MPRGVPNAGFRATKNWVAANGNPVHINTRPKALTKTTESDDAIDVKLRQRFEIVAGMTEAALDGSCRAMIVSGPPGLGKSYTIEKIIDENDPHRDSTKQLKGIVGLPGLYRTLHDYRRKGEVIVFDDSDNIFYDNGALNLLKSACDSSDIRRLSYLKNTNDVSERWGTPLEREILFEGSIIFITNLDFDEMIRKGSKLAPHLAALISRAHYIDLEMKTQRDYLVRIKQVVKEGMLRLRGLRPDQEAEVMSFIMTHKDRLRELSLRIVVKVADLLMSKKPNWKQIAELTCCKNE